MHQVGVVARRDDHDVYRWAQLNGLSYKDRIFWSGFGGAENRPGIRGRHADHKAPAQPTGCDENENKGVTHHYKS